MPKLAIPTGYEADQRKAASRRKLAEQLMMRSLQAQGGMQSWTQPLAQVFGGFMGKRMENKADEMDADVSSRMREAYSMGMENLRKDSEGGMSNSDITMKYGTDPLMQDAIKPFQDAYAQSLKERENVVKFGGKMQRTGDIMGQREPGDPNDAVIIDPQTGEWKVNPVRTTAALRAQGFSGGGAGIPEVMSMPDPMAIQPPQGAPPAPSGGGDGMDLSLLSPDEITIMRQELSRRAAGGSPNVGGVDTSMPSGSPLTAQRKPDGAVAGKPYWLINGVPYDNPEGK